METCYSLAYELLRNFLDCFIEFINTFIKCTLEEKKKSVNGECKMQDAKEAQVS